MHLSRYHLPIAKNNPTGAHTLASKFMIKAGMVRQISSGLYSWLPFGTSILHNICEIIREELDLAGAQEIIMPCIQPLELWKKSGRYGENSDLRSQMLHIKDRHGDEFTFTPTAEELVCDLMKQDLQSYRSLPKNMYQIQWKFRDEIRPRYGVMRAREFLMKDSYSFAITPEEALQTYEHMLNAYMQIYRRLGLEAMPVAASTGAIGGNYSHELHILAETGESEIFYEANAKEILKQNYIKLDDLNLFYTAEEEKHAANLVNDANLQNKILLKSKSVEIGHLFYLGQKYSSLMDVKLQDSEGKLVSPHMGCYGIGVSRLVAAMIESLHGAHGMIWPTSVSPFIFHLLNLGGNDENCTAVANNIYESLAQIGKTCKELCKAQSIVLFDDTQDNPKIKLDKADLIGIPYQIIVGPRGVAEDKIEIKNRKENTIEYCSVSNLRNKIIDIMSKI